MFAVALCAASTVYPQSATSATRTGVPRPELAADFSYLRSNAPVSGCGCFGLDGASLTLAVPILPGPFAFAGDVTSAENTSIAPNNYHLTLSTFTAGLRYTPNLCATRLHPFAQATTGFAHASQDLVKGYGASVPNAAVTLAVDLGGGVDLDLNHRFRLRLAQASYLMTTFDNGANNRQNNLRLSAGLVLRF
jgi:hypothetical protein